jgi:RNA polymerase sigma factor (sigma-70 family)
MELTGECAVVLRVSLAAHCPDPDSSVLLRGIAQGDLSAFWKLWIQNQSHLLSVCLREMGGNRPDAEDALSIAMLRALDRLPYHASAVINVRAWLTRLTSNLCKEIHRSRLRQNALAANIGAHWLAEEPASRLPETPEDSVLHHEIVECLKDAIQRLPRPLRDPFILRLRDELQSSEIADRLELSSENVRKRIQIARSILRGKLQQYLAGPAHARRINPHPGASSSNQLTLLASVDQDPAPQAQSITGQAVYFKSVRVTLKSDIELDYCLVLPRKPTRERTRIRTLLKYSEQHPNGWKKTLELAYLLYTIGRWDESISLYRYVIAKRPQLTNVWIQLGNILSVAMRRLEAIDVYEQALANRTKPLVRHMLAGMIQSCRGDHQRAAREFEAASRLEPFLPRLRYLWGLACQKAMIFDRMLDVFDRTLELNPDDPIALICRHDALLALGRREDASRQIDHVLMLNPNSSPALQRLVAERCNIGLVSGTEGRKTLCFIRKLIKLAPHNPNNHELPGLFYFQRGEIDKTTKSLSEYTRRHPNNPVGWFLLSKWLYRVGRAASADSALSTARRLFASCGPYPAACGEHAAAVASGPQAPGQLGLVRLQKEMAACFPDRHFVLLP